MDHDALKQKLMDFYDGELIRIERLEIESHLKACAECRQALEHWRKTAKALFKQPGPEASEFFVQQVLKRIAGAALKRRRPSWAGVRWLVPAFGLAAMMLVVLRPVEQAVTVDALLFDDARQQAATRLMLASEKTSQDDVLGFMMEDSP